jgi:hypothetical protein
LLVVEVVVLAQVEVEVREVLELEQDWLLPPEPITRLL